MRKVIFVAPAPSGTTLRFARGAGALEQVEVLGVFQHPPADRSVFRDWALVPDASDPAHIQRGVQSLMQRHGRPHRLLAVLEQIQSEVAWVREQLQIPGQSLAVAQRMRDKGLMKQALEQAGLPCARYARLRGVQDALRFIHQVGFPIILKPPAGAGCKATWRVENPAQLEEALADVRPSPQNEVLAEEFLRGREYSFETVTVGGQPLFHSISRYLPTPLEAMENDWIQWVCMLPRDISGPEYHAARQVGVRAVKAMGFQDGITHMEWFRRPDQSVAIGEIAGRPPGAQIVRMNELVHDIDMSHIWARATIDGAFDGPWERKYAVGTAFFRGMGRGRIMDVKGLDRAQERVGRWVVDARLPVKGWFKSDSYEGDGYAIVRHPDTDTLVEILKELISTVRVVYES